MLNGKPKFWGVASIGERGQIVIPVKLREELGIDKSDQFVIINKGKMIGLIREKEMTSMLKEWIENIEEMKNNETK